MRKLILTNILAIIALTMSAQVDVTKHFLTNYGFDEYFDYTSGQTTAVAQEILDVKGWTTDINVNYTIVGTYEFGFKGTFNGATIPATGYDGETGGGLAISTGWGEKFLFSQTVTLPAGKYTITAPTYNGCSSTPATSQLAWIPVSGSAVKSALTSYTANAWTLDQITFTLTKTTTGKIQFGMIAAAGGSANSAKLVVDYVKISAEDMAVDKSMLTAAINTAKTYYDDGSGNGAAELLTAINEAQAVADNADATMIEVLEATSVLNEAIENYRKQNVSEENPLDKTGYILNPSFEEGLKNWTSTGFNTQTNSSFTKKNGSTYIEKWTGQGSKVGDAAVSQTISNLPNGIYKLTVGAQNLNQSSTSQKCEGACIYADDQKTAVYTPNDYSVKFVNLTNGVTIGFEAVGATGNWLAVDNFRLSLIGEVSGETIMQETARLIAEAETLRPLMMYQTTAETLDAAIEQAKAITATSTDGEVANAIKAIRKAISDAKTAVAEYQALADAIAEAETAYDETLNNAEALKAEIENAKALYTNASATPSQLEEQIAILQKAVLAFHLANATEGTGTAPAVTSTNKYVATGATQALIRAATTGSNILERGVCWSTEHNPTVLDYRTTKSFSLNGTIFHIKGLKPSTVYYARPYIMNKTYTVAYGDEIKIVTHPAGGCTWDWDGGAPDDAANTRCRNAMKETIDYFNEWTGIRGFHLSGHYGAQTPTADCSYGGWMRIGPNAAYQAIGTVLHETGHGVGVGTHWVWNNCTYTRETNGNKGKWLGRAANEVYQFLENKYTAETYFKGDAVHGWGNDATYDWLVNGADKDTHQELQYIGGMCILYGLFIDGLCPTSSYPNGIAGYTYNFDDSKKYYIMNKDVERGLGEGLLSQQRTSVVWKPCLAQEEINDSSAWYMEFVPSQGYYRFKNAISGRYLSHSTASTSMTTKQTSSPSTTELFQLMPDRTDVTIGTGDNTITTHGYWLTWNDNGNKAINAKALSERVGYGTLEQVSFNFSNAATKQQWIIISEDELEAYHNAAVASGIRYIYTNDKSADGTKTVTGIYTANGLQLGHTAKGLNIIRYSDGTTKKIFVK